MSIDVPFPSEMTESVPVALPQRRQRMAGAPAANGLYDPRFEHDACGVSFVVDMHGRRTHNLVQLALESLCNLDHRGAKGSEENTGDGAGILLQVPHEFFQAVCPEAGIADLGEPGSYAVGLVFLPAQAEAAAEAKAQIAAIAAVEGVKVHGWRPVPTDDSSIGSMARSVMPSFEQIFISYADESGATRSGIELDRAVFPFRKRVEHEVVDPASGDGVYIASLSSRTLVYKGMLTTPQLGEFFLDLSHPELVSALCLVHSRFSTNTFPSWPLAHPYRYVAHNGEINTVQGNQNWMRAREALLETPLIPGDLSRTFPICTPGASDTARFDEVLELLHLGGYSLPHAALMMIPEAWENHTSMDQKRRDFYKFHGAMMEPWDGPASITFTDGTVVGAVLDRNGLRPSRYWVCDDGLVVMASEVGTLSATIADRTVIRKGRLQPGRMFLIDTEQGRIVEDEEIKSALADAHPYGEWLAQGVMHLEDFPERPHVTESHMDTVRAQQIFGYTTEELKVLIAPMAKTGAEPIGSMGTDTPIAVLSNRSRLLFDYFSQLFAQVTNPPLDAIREELVTSLGRFLGPESNLLNAGPDSCELIEVPFPILDNDELRLLQNLDETQPHGFRSRTVYAHYPVAEGGEGLRNALAELRDEVEQAVAEGINVVVISDWSTKDMAPIPILLATSAVHHHLIRTKRRTKVGLVIETGQAREVHHFALLLGYGAAAINPYLAFDSIEDMIRSGALSGIEYEAAVKNYIKAAGKGILKVMSKMGISTVASYTGAQIFEAIGLSGELIDEYFTDTVSRLGGVGLDQIAAEVAGRQALAWPDRPETRAHRELHPGGEYQWRREGEYHLFNPETVYKLQHSTRAGKEDVFREYTSLVNDQSENLATLRGLFAFDSEGREPVPLDEVESAAEIVKRFSTGAMSYGSISAEAHETLAIAMNRLGARSNTGEGGEDPDRFIPDANGDSRRSAIEDLAQLIHDLKNSNPAARVHVKLVAEVGVGTVAAGVAKAKADVVLISGHDGGTGASPLTSLKHAGAPWELGLAETQQTLLLNGLRDRVVVQVDGQLKTGRDVVIAALLGAEEFGFATAPLVVSGCVMMRVCHLDTCPVGVATQNPELRARFSGKPEFVERFMIYIANEVREILASLGFRSIEEAVGRVDALKMDQAISHWKASGLDISPILHAPVDLDTTTLHNTERQNHGLDVAMDVELIEAAKAALEDGTKVEIDRPIRNVNRTVGTMLGHEVTKRWGGAGLPDNTIDITLRGSAGNSLGAFLPRGISLRLIGDANDYVGKGLSGGRITVRPPLDAHPEFVAEESIIAGNVVLYGATSGTALIRGVAGERFAVRNSGATAVVEGVGDHACEYMTGGLVVVLGRTGRNFGAGMSGGVALVYDPNGELERNHNPEMIDLEDCDPTDVSSLHALLVEHAEQTGSSVAARLLDDWPRAQLAFTKVMPRDYRRVLDAAAKARAAGEDVDAAIMAAAMG